MPMAGLSTRFPGMRPKYTLTTHDGHMMWEKAVLPLIKKHHVTIGVLQEHEDAYPIKEYAKGLFGDKVTVVTLKTRTKGPADTVFQVLKQANIPQNTEILIKDCDSFFEHDYQKGNYVCVSSMKDHEVLKRVGAKSFVTTNDQDTVLRIVEKEIVSDKFCVGGYKFESAGEFVEVYKELEEQGEVFVSHVIDYMLQDKKIFSAVKVRDYVDVGTAEEWFEYNDKACIFCDIDGTLFKAQHRKDFGKPPELLEKNAEILKREMARGSRIIFTTARPERVRKLIEQQLADFGFGGCDMIMGLPNTKRILINDFNDANPRPRAIAINVRRDQDDLGDFL